MKKNFPEIPRKQLSEKTKNLVVVTAINSILLTFLYFASMGANVIVIPPLVITPYPIMLGQIVYIAYWAVFAIFFLIFFFYNHAFTRKGVTVDMLPDTMSPEEKQAYLDEITRRSDKSKWMITIIFPLIMTFMIDIVLLYMIEPFMENFGI